jgi:hypothetical protein
VTHGEKMARAALAQWVKLYERQQRCEHCQISAAQCSRHRSKTEFDKLAEQTRRLLAGGPN